MHLSECASVADVSIFLVKSSAILAHFLVLYMLAVLTGMYRILAYFAKKVKKVPFWGADLVLLVVGEGYGF